MRGGERRAGRFGSGGGGGGGGHAMGRPVCSLPRPPPRRPASRSIPPTPALHRTHVSSGPCSGGPPRRRPASYSLQAAALGPPAAAAAAGAGWAGSGGGGGVALALALAGGGAAVADDPLDARASPPPSVAWPLRARRGGRAGRAAGVAAARTDGRVAGRAVSDGGISLWGQGGGGKGRGGRAPARAVPHCLLLVSRGCPSSDPRKGVGRAGRGESSAVRVRAAACAARGLGMGEGAGDALQPCRERRGGEGGGSLSPFLGRARTPPHSLPDAAPLALQHTNHTIFTRTRTHIDKYTF